MANKTDLSGYVFFKSRILGLRIYSYLCTILCKFRLIFRGIQFGKRIKFYGLSHFSRFHRSKIKIGDNCRFRSGYFANRMGINKKCFLATLRIDAEIIIGNNVGLSGAVVTSAGKVTIGNNVLLGANSFITDFDWHGIEPDKRNSPPEPKEVILEDNVWLGFNAVVLKGVTIGENSVIGTNSVVTKDIPPNVIAAGNPCKVIKEIKIEK